LAGIEKANASKTFTNCTAACVMIALELAGICWQPQAGQVLDGFAAAIETALASRNRMADFCAGAAAVDVIGRGPALGGAAMGALCLREMTRIRACAHTGGGFRHGPILDVDSSHLAIILAFDQTRELAVRLARDCVARGGKVILVADRPVQPEQRLLPVCFGAFPEPWSALASVLVPQALSLALIERSGTAYVRLTTTTQ